jgi:hypothetical protein
MQNVDINVRGGMFERDTERDGRVKGEGNL